MLSRIVEKLQVSEPVARSLLLESRTLFQSYDLGDRVFTVSCGGDPAKAYGRQMQMRLLFQRIGEVLSPRELNLVRCYLGIGQPEEQGMTFQELAVRLNYNGPSGAEKAYKRAIRKLKQHLHGGGWTSSEHFRRRGEMQSRRPVTAHRRGLGENRSNLNEIKSPKL